jgi:hypothetical protein
MDTKHSALRRCVDVLAKLIARWSESEDEAYLARATDLADLELRTQRLGRCRAHEWSVWLSLMSRSRG